MDDDDDADFMLLIHSSIYSMGQFICWLGDWLAECLSSLSVDRDDTMKYNSVFFYRLVLSSLASASHRDD